MAPHLRFYLAAAGFLFSFGTTTLGTVALAQVTIGFCQTASSLDETASVGSICVEQIGSVSGKPARVNYRVIGGSATPDVDFSLPPGELRFKKGTSSEPLPIVIFNDLEIEGDETISIELFSPTSASLDDLRRIHVLTIRDVLPGTTGLRVNKFKLKPDSLTPARSKVQLVGEFNDEMRLVDLDSGGGITFGYGGGLTSDTLAQGGFTLVRGAKYAYMDTTRKGKFLHRIGGSSRTKFSFVSRGDFDVLRGVTPMRVSIGSDGFSDEVSVVPVIGLGGSKFNIVKNPYAAPELYVDSLIVKRFPFVPDKHSIRLTLRFPGASTFRPESDQLTLDLGFFQITVAPKDWKRSATGKTFFHTRRGTVAKVTVRINPERRTLSLRGTRLDLPGPEAATPEASIGVAFSDLAKVNTVKLQLKTTASGAEIFRY